MECCTKIIKKKKNPARVSLSSLLLPGLLLVTPASVLADTYYAEPGDDDKTIGTMLESARPGDTVYLGDGEYTGEAGAIQTVKNGKKDNPITIKGSPKAVIKGSIDSRAVNVFHDYIHLKVRESKGSSM